VLDYGFSVAAGRLLLPVEYSILVSVLAILQILLHVTNVIRNVTAYYTAEISARTENRGQVGPFFWRGLRWAGRWGVLAAVSFALLSIPLAGLLQMPTVWPLWAAALALLMLFMRPITDGTLQGLQRFRKLAVINVFQAGLRLTTAVVLISLGWQAFGAVLALPIATFTTFALALWFLRPYVLGEQPEPYRPTISWQYSTYTFFGLLFYALLVNLDIIFTRASFPPEIAATYAAVATLGKINLFISVAIGMVLFPKAIERYTQGRTVWPILSLSFGIILLPGLLMTTLFFLFPSEIVHLVFRNDFGDPGAVLGFIGLATTLFGGINLWLNYTLATQRTRYVYLMGIALLVQIIGLLLFNSTLLQIALVQVTAGIVGNVAGLLFSLVKR
jgi:O-antigen/teichoic acid export membrane protein